MHICRQTSTAHLCLFISVMPEPAIGFSEVIKDVHTSLRAARLQHNGGRRVHLCTHPAAVEDVEDQHAKKEEGTDDAHIPGQLMLSATK